MCLYTVVKSPDTTEEDAIGSFSVVRHSHRQFTLARIEAVQGDGDDQALTHTATKEVFTALGDAVAKGKSIVRAQHGDDKAHVIAELTPVAPGMIS